MKLRRNSKLRVLLGLTAVPTVFLCFANGAAPAATTNAPASEAQIRQSQFDDNLPNGRDPFFPRSQSRAAPTLSTNVLRAATSMLVIRGVSIRADKRVVVIGAVAEPSKSWSFEAGDAREIVLAGSRMKIRCEEIRDDLVVVSVGYPPQRIELRLPKRF